ncbi:uncharacterized protein C9orf131 homolog [Nannospalax galili]|uniref:uncharacterized protein C9orf131 homolog n=1 Tax=Nannospalax galili TaxID=1026970 RepID=UPI0004ED10C6|nr:uncharacterized protein C9orf131 homolog [Nannospalax galili]
MEWLSEDLLEAEGNMGLLHNQLAQSLACRRCNSSICLQSPGNLSLQLLHHLAFLSCLWKQKSEEEEDGEEKKEEESFTLEPLKPCSLSKGILIGNQDTTAPPQPSCSSEGLPKTTEIPEQVFTQPSSPFRSFPTFQILNNLPVRNKIASESSLQQRKSQLFWGLPSLHSESLETIFLSSDGPSPLKLSVCPSVFFNKVACLPAYNLLLPYYFSPTHYPNPDAHTVEDLAGMALTSQLVPHPSSPPKPSLSFHLKPLPVGCKGVLSDAEAHTQWLTQQREVPWVSKSQALNSQPELQRIRHSVFLKSSEDLKGMLGNSSLHQHNPESRSVSLLYPFSPQGVLTRFEAPRMTIRQNEYLKASESVMPTASPSLPSLSECQRVNPVGDLSGLKTFWETTEQKENLQISEPSILTPCQSTVSTKTPQETVPPGTQPRYEVQWGIIVHKETPQAFELLMPASHQPSGSLSELQNINPKGRLSSPKDFWGNMGYRQNLKVAKSPMPAPCPPLDSLLDSQKKSPLENLSIYEPWGQCRENSGNLWAFETPVLDFNTWLYATIPACVPSGSEAQWKSRPNRENHWVSANIVSSLSPPSSSLPHSIVMGPQAVSLESKALWETKGQGENLCVFDSPDPIHRTALALVIEPQSINTVVGFPRSESIWNIEHSRNSWASETPCLALKPSPALILEPLRVSSMVDPFNSKMCYKDIQIRKKPLAFDCPAHSLPQYLLEASPSGVPCDFVPMEGYMKQKENCVSVFPAWVPNPLPNSVSKSHISEPSGDQCNCKPIGGTAEQRKASWATEQAAPSSHSVSSQEPHIDFEIICINMQERETSQHPRPPVVNLHPTSWSPILAKALEFEPIQPGLQKAEMFSEAKAEASSSQGGAVPEVVKAPGIQAWQWSEELKLRLKKLRQSSAFQSPGPSHSLYSSPVLNSPTPSSWGLSFCPPHQTPPLSLHPCSPHCNPKKVQWTVPQPVQVPHFSCSSFQSQLLASGRVEQESQKKKRMKQKIVTQIPSPGCIHVKAGKNCSGTGKSSNTGVLVSDNRQDKTIIVFSDQKTGSPRKSKTGGCGEGTARLCSFTVMGNSHPPQAWRPAEAHRNKFSRPQYRGQSTPYTVLPQQPLSKATGPQGHRRVGLVAGDTPKPHHYKR